MLRHVAVVGVADALMADVILQAAAVVQVVI